MRELAGILLADLYPALYAWWLQVQEMPRPYFVRRGLTPDDLPTSRHWMNEPWICWARPDRTLVGIAWAAGLRIERVREYITAFEAGVEAILMDKGLRTLLEAKAWELEAACANKPVRYRPPSGGAQGLVVVIDAGSTHRSHTVILPDLNTWDSQRYFQVRAVAQAPRRLGADGE